MLKMNLLDFSGEVKIRRQQTLCQVDQINVEKSLLLLMLQAVVAGRSSNG